MKMMFDTSIFISGFVASHSHHKTALKWLEKVKTGKIELLVSGHTLLECYAVLTRLPLSPKIDSSVALHIIKENILPLAEIITLTSEEYINLLNRLSTAGLGGGIVYDAIILQAALKGKAEKILTFNTRDFIKLYPDDESFVVSP